MAVVVHALQFVQPEPYQHAFELGEAQQVIGLLGGAVGGFLWAAIEQQEVLVFVEVEQGGREGTVAAVDMGVDQRSLVDQRAQQLAQLARVADQESFVRGISRVDIMHCSVVAVGHGIYGQGRAPARIGARLDGDIGSCTGL